MSKSYSIALYALTVSESHKQGTEKDLSGPIGTFDNFYAFLADFLRINTVNGLVESDSHYLRIKQSEQDNTKPFIFIDGVVEGGESGYSAVLHSTKTKKERMRNTDDAELVPFYFCFSETTDPKMVVLCVQRLGNIGIKTILTQTLKQKFNEVFPKHKLSITDLLPEFYANQFLEGNNIKRIEYTHLVPVGDVATNLNANGLRDHKKGLAVIKLSIQPQRGTMYQFANLASGIKDAFASVHPKVLKLDDSTRVDTTFTLENEDGKKRTFSLISDRNPLPYIDVSREVEKGDDGHPVIDSLRRAVLVILNNSQLLKSNGKN